MNRLLLIATTASALALYAQRPAPAVPVTNEDPPAKIPIGFTALFNGKDLTGWHVSKTNHHGTAPDYRVAPGGQGASASFVTFGPDSPKVVVPVAGTFRALAIYSPGTHPAYSVTLLVNGAASALACGVSAAETTATDRTHAVDVVAGDDVCFSVNVNPFGVGVGYPLALSVEFEGAAQFYSVSPETGAIAVGNTQTGGALGNGRMPGAGSVRRLSGMAPGLLSPGVSGARGSGSSVSLDALAAAASFAFFAS